MKITSTIAERIVTAVEESSLPLHCIAAYCGITDKTFRNWLRNGEAHLQQLEEGKIKKSDLNTNEKKELDLYQRVTVARMNLEIGDLKRIYEIAEEKGDVKAFQWLLKIQNPFYHDADIEDVEAASEPEAITVVHLNDCGRKDGILLREFLNGTVYDDEEKQGGNEDTRYSNES